MTSLPMTIRYIVQAGERPSFAIYLGEEFIRSFGSEGEAQAAVARYEEERARVVRRVLERERQ